MDTDYDRQFEEMKKYIPFLESMIKRLESTGTTSANPRQTQLAKIRSLRMKMENLLKCEQVLVNLYAKVEQRDSFTDTKSDMNKSVNTQNVELDFVQNKLKTVASKMQDPETLPEIARASQTEETCTADSKKPALFQRRPNKNSTSPTRGSLDGSRDILSPSGRRSYARVLMSLNTKDILSRIINCSDGDVDIDTLRELRTQILSELKQTGAKDDISDLILKSYKNKKEVGKKKDKVEEGELSDSESEVIESIYGSLVIMDKDQGNTSCEQKSLDLESAAKQEVVHEIDILQALKNEILSEKISIDDSETVTPPLHQPKVTKVANIEEIVSKKRISIEKYKQKSISASKSSTLINDANSNAYRDELSEKQSIKLTEKEFERFNLSSKLALGESSEDKEFGKRGPNNDDIYGDLAPKSPDHEDFADTGIKPPVIIPADAPICSVVEKHDPNDAFSNDFQNPLYSEANSTMFNRLECPQTPMNSFGTSDCPSTLTHTFGLLETPMTPIHTFGRSDMPMTPVPSFGRADCPPTPIHPFDRTEVMMTPSHPFGVTDFSQNQVPSQMSSIRYNKVQEPRINRSSESDNLSKYNDMKDCGKYQERNFNNRNYKYDAPKRAYADSYRNYGGEQSVGRNDKNATYERIENRHGERPRRENSSGLLNRSYEVDRNYSHDRGKAYRDRDHRNDNDGGKIYYDRDLRWNYRREHSVGRAVPDNRHIGKHCEREVRPENSLCVQSYAGFSFTIDTSVSRSFQESIENLKKDSISDSNFDVRRRRASSVGRSMIREPSIGKELPSLGNSHISNNKNISYLLQNDENNKHKNHVDVISENNVEVSTTENENPLVQADILSPSKETISQLESCSTPDSTIDVNENTQDKVGEETVPDSTNELACEISSDIMSTHDSHVCENAQTETSVSRMELSHHTGNIGSLLSILKDKSKIKELLIMLKDQPSENEKLKKKLEKLSEIVSDDDDSPHDESNSVHNEKINISASNNNNEIESAGNSGVHADTTLVADNVSCEKNEQSMRNEKHNVEDILDVQFRGHEQNATSVENCEGKEPFEDTKQNTKNDDGTVEAVSCKKSTKIKKSTKKTKDKIKNITSGDKKSLTRSESANLKMNKPANIKNAISSRELKQLQDDIKEMFLHDDVFNAGIRMCRLAKLVEDKPIDKGETQNNENSPVVILEKIKECSEETTIKGKTSKKKATSKSKMLQKDVYKTESSSESINSELKLPIKYRPGPKSKTRLLDKQAEVDSYIFESDSVSESNATNISETKPHSSSDSECESLESSKSFGSTELSVELKKKPKRKRRGWQAGVIKPKHKKKKTDFCYSQSDTNMQVMPQIPDLNCFTNKTYCFYKNVSVYSCRLCLYNGNDIVHHYKKQHPHSEIPLSRMSPEVAKEAIEKCEEINFNTISKVTTDKYVCLFCFKELKKTVLEEFFWHVVSMHTGEYKQLCSECINGSGCPFNFHIPPPPKEQKGQLIGYICGKCNFTQISLENLKTHVVNRHNDEQTEVYTINLAVMSKKTLLAFSKSIPEQPRTLRSSRLNQSTVETNDEHSDFNESGDNATEPNKVTPIPLKEETLIELQKNKRNKIQSRITFENDDATNELCELNKNKSVKVEQEHVINAQDSSPYNEPVDDAPIADMVAESHETIKNVEYNQPPTSDDILDYPHFKINFTEAGTKEYVCCINGVESHYRTALLISFKKHVQIKHTEKWDGFCFLCKLIVTPQGNHNFKDCLQHFLDKHFDNFPTMEKVDDKKNNMETSDVKPKKNYLNVRPLSELISQSEIQPEQPKLSIIESVVSLGGSTDEASSGINVDTAEIRSTEQEFKYEEAQAEIIAKKYKVVLDVMMNREKLVHIFKCAGRFCSYSTDNAEDALRHAVTHERVGGENSLSCTYCDFDSSKNAVDLVTHVFKTHGCCQYVCGHCFYRSVASQLVRAHASRTHGKAPGQSVILRTTVTARSDTEYKILPREIAVPFFACNQNVMDAKCKFKSYTSGKFYEHLQIRHQLDISFLCFMCSEVFTKPVDLLQHFKIHGFKLYQCTWCVHGAENETELLAHASEKHPNKQPQAYLRVITNKEGTSGFRVLPLAHLNNSNITTIDVKPNNVRNNPEREAERSIDLEKLIGQTTRMIVSMVTSSQNESIKNCTFNELETISMPLFELGSLSQAQSQESLVLTLQSSLFDKTPETSISSDVGPAPISADLSRPETPNLASQPINSDVHNQLTPVLKGEPEPNTPEKTDCDVVYCLDSDEEISNENVIDLSSEESPLVAVVDDKSGKLEKVPLSRLFKCSLCSIILKSNSGFKRHVSACHTEATNLLPCAYCPFVAQRDLVAKHYLSDHCLNRKEATRSYVCGVCNNKYISFSFVKTHLKDDHNLSKLVVTSKLVTNGEYQFVVSEASKQKQVAKRKLSNDNEDKSLQPVTKMKKFGPNDVNLFPINPILDELVYCSLCEFSTKVRLNMVRHLQLHAEQQPVPQTAPVNPVPHLETNEKHFDKMVNLASSSIASRALEKLNKTDRHPVVNLLIPPEAASRYPKYVPDRQRYTCGAKGCCYISVDEMMLKYHWETLHSGTNDFHCVHCPPYQHLDTTKPLTACRIIAHLKMHDIRLYACSSCSYYHHRRQVLDKHIAEIHSTGHVMVVREESVSQTLNVTQPSTVAPTMDLKPWQCGLCKFKSMLRPEVVEHCAKIHQSKMQYKCTYCAFRTSTLENVTKHQSKSHAGKAQETFYFYYREGSIPGEPDGTSRWQKQRQKSSATETEVKTETIERTELESQSELTKNVPQSPARPTVDLNIVKQHTDAVTVPAHTTQDLCKTFGQFCEPNGLKYKCPLCKNTVEDSRDAMQSHLYEELQCRNWGCGFCSYKAFHKNGLNDHMLTEHRNNREPIELPVDVRVETWIAKLLDHQFLLIEKNKQNLTKQSTAVVPVNSAPTTSKSQDAHMNVPESDNGHSEEELEKMFGTFGTSENKSFNCPKCSLKIREESAMRDHLEIELNKIRWCCNNCTEKFQNYREAQFHCKSVHPGITARAFEAVRNVGMRSAWISAVIRAQKLSMNHLPVTENTDSDETIANSLAQDNSLLVVRYEERVPTPDIQVIRSRTSGAESDEDEEKLVIDEVFNQVNSKQSPFCIYTCQDIRELKEHVVGQHNNIKPYFCFYCDFNGYRKTVVKHVSQKHKDKPLVFLTKGQRMLGRPTSANAVSASAPVAVKDDATRLICLRCEKPFNENEAKTHFHDNTKPKFAKTGQTVVKCRLCLTLHENIDEAAAHHHTSHPNKTFKYITFKLHCNKRSIFSCAYCDHNFSVWADLKVHWRLVHSSLPFKFNKGQCAGTASDVVINLSDDEETRVKRKSESILINPSPSKMCARKSTTKLPIQAVAKKSTTKLPFNLESDSDSMEYSFYGSKPQVDDLDNVTTNMSFCNMVVPFTFKKLSEVIRINPIVLVQDIKK